MHLCQEQFVPGWEVCVVSETWKVKDEGRLGSAGTPVFKPVGGLPLHSRGHCLVFFLAIRSKSRSAFKKES